MTSLDTSAPTGQPVVGAFPEGQIDPRGSQFGAALAAGVLAVVLATAPSPLAIALLAVQARSSPTGPCAALTA